MLGALEINVIRRIAREKGAAWKPQHAAILAYLLARRNRHTGIAWPDPEHLAEWSGISRRSTRRYLMQLEAWGLVDRLQPRALSTRQFRQMQYTFPFESVCCSPSTENVPAPDLEDAEPPRFQPEPVAKAVATGRWPISKVAGGQNEPEPVAKAVATAIRKEPEDLKPEDLGAEPLQSVETPASTVDVPLKNFAVDQLARTLMQICGIPNLGQNAFRIKIAIQCEAEFSGLAPPEAAQSLSEAIQRDRRVGIEINRFYFEDAKWRNNGTERSNTRSSASAERAERTRRNVLDGVTKAALRAIRPDGP